MWIACLVQKPQPHVSFICTIVPVLPGLKPTSPSSETNCMGKEQAVLPGAQPAVSSRCVCPQRAQPTSSSSLTLRTAAGWAPPSASRIPGTTIFTVDFTVWVQGMQWEVNYKTSSRVVLFFVFLMAPSWLWHNSTYNCAMKMEKRLTLISRTRCK